MDPELQQSLQSLTTEQLVSDSKTFVVFEPLPESPAGTGEAEGLEPPKRLLNKAAILIELAQDQGESQHAPVAWKERCSRAGRVEAPAEIIDASLIKR